jgi:multiple sugar transport system permease protein
MKPAIVVQAVLIFAGLWNNYYIPALVLQSREKMIYRF